MPVSEDASHVNLAAVCRKIDQSGPSSADYEFIRSILQDIMANSVIQESDQIGYPEPVDRNAAGTVEELVALLEKHGDVESDAADDGGVAEAHQLLQLLTDDDLQGLLHAHDDIANRNFGTAEDPVVMQMRQLEESAPPENATAVRIVGVRRKPNQPLGLTVYSEGGGELVVSKINPGSLIDQQGLLHVGDIVKEVNGTEVFTPEQLTEMIRQSGPDITFKVIPAAVKHLDPEPRPAWRRSILLLDDRSVLMVAQEANIAPIFLRAHFSYNPERDTQIHPRSNGLAFDEGDILRVIKKDEKQWWEATNLSTRQKGLIPSPATEERRRAAEAQAAEDKEEEKTKSSFLCGLGRKKKKVPAASKPVAPPPAVPAILYEEVCRVGPSRRRTLVLAGAQGIGRRSMKIKIVTTYADEFGAAVPSTSRPRRDGEVDGRNYRFLSHEEMQRDIAAGNYLEHGELRGNYYGTSFDALRDVIDQNKVCVVDAKATVLSKLRTAEWTPYIVFLSPSNAAALRDMNERAIALGCDVAKKSEEDIKRILEESSKIQRLHKHLFDDVLRFDDFDAAFRKIINLFDSAQHEPQWVPASWEQAPGMTKLPVPDGL